MKLYSTTDIAKSIHKACADFTHVILNRGYTLIRPVFFNTGKLGSLRTYQYASWIPETCEAMAQRWLDNGGVLIDQDTAPHHDLTPDVTVMVECPYSMDRLVKCNTRNVEYGVIPHPMSWTTHETCMNLRFPEVEVLEALWRHCGHQAMTNADLAIASDVPVSAVQYMKNSFNPREHWYMKKRLAPERDEFMEAWDWLQDGTIPKSEVKYRRMVEEMAKFGYIDLKKVFHYPTQEPDWKKLEKRREDALIDLASVRSLVESLPDHLAEQEPSGESL